MTQYKGEKPKIYELARELEMKSDELMEILERAGKSYKGPSAVVHETPEEIHSIVVSQLRKEDDELIINARENGVNLIGFYLDPETRKYHVGTIKLSIKEFQELGGTLGKAYSTIYNAMPDFRVIQEKIKLLYPKK